MKNFLFFVVMIIAFYSCAQQKQLVQQPHFDIKNAYYTQTGTNTAQGGSIIDVYVSIKNLPEDVELTELYFKGHVSKDIKTMIPGTIAIRFKMPERGDVILSSDMKEESNNPLPHVPVNAPVKIGACEALLAYKKGNKEFYTKIDSIPNHGIQENQNSQQIEQ